MNFEPGSRVGDYEILSVLGAGGMGKVYKVRNIISDRIEAMKVLLPNLEQDPTLADRFLREIKVQASLDHPNIAALHTAQRDENRILMILEYVEGETLDHILRRGPVPLSDTVNYISQVLEALIYAHGRGVVHRDIKPANMMLTPQGTVKLMDFGIARLASDPKLTQTRQTVGSLYYMSPEQIKGSTVDARSDLYSLGVSLYQLLTGKKPFEGDSDFALMAAHLNNVPVPPIELEPSLPPAMNDLILTAIAKGPDQRFQSAEAFRRAIQTVAGQPAPAAALPVAAQATPTKSSHRGLYMALGSVATLIVLAVAVTQGPKFFRAKAVDEPAAEPAATQAGQPPAQTPPPAAEPQPQAPEPQPPAAATAEPPRSAPVAPPVRSVRQPPASEPARAQQPPAQEPPVQQPPVQQPPAQQPASPPPPPVVRQAAPPPATAALEKLRDRMMMLATRVNTVQRSLDRLRQNQQAYGMGLRGDMASAAQRMVFHMDEAEGALKAGNAAAAAKSLYAAEREVERLEKFLNL